MAADDAAEAALSVQRTYQNRGVGTELLRRLIVLARNRSIRSLHMLCLLENGKVLHIARKLGAKLTFDHSEMEGWLALPGPNRLTLLLELLDDTSTVLASLRPVGRALQRQMRRSGNPRDSKPRSDGKTNLGCVHRPRFVLDGRYAKGQRGERGSGACRRARIRPPAPRHQDAVRLAQLGDGMPSEARRPTPRCCTSRGRSTGGRRTAVRLHRIDATPTVAPLGWRAQGHPDRELLVHLREAGRAAAARWLRARGRSEPRCNLSRGAHSRPRPPPRRVRDDLGRSAA
jgi:Acetyltransferase (GNAT) family